MESGLPKVELRENSVLKRFIHPGAYERELSVYQRQLPMVPRLLSYKHPEWIEVQRIDGSAYLHRDFSQEEAAGLASVIARFHASTSRDERCLCHWDNQPRNILGTGSDFYLIDFSESRVSLPEDDLSHLFLFWAAEFTPERLRSLTGAFLSVYRKLTPLDTDSWARALARSKRRFDLRRRRYGRHEGHLPQGQLRENRAILAGLLSRPA